MFITCPIHVQQDPKIVFGASSIFFSKIWIGSRADEKKRSRQYFKDPLLILHPLCKTQFCSSFSNEQIPFVWSMLIATCEVPFSTNI